MSVDRTRSVSIEAERTDCYTGVKRSVSVRAFLKKGYICLEDGPTGYESAPIEMLYQASDSEEWNACMGTEKRWDKMNVSIRELRKAVREILGL